MTRTPDFEALYRAQSDPWQVGSSWYEHRKLDLALAALSRRRYRRAWDPAAGTGHLAARLAERCDEVLAVHWRPEPHDAWLSGAAVQRELAETLAGWRRETDGGD